MGHFRIGIITVVKEMYMTSMYLYINSESTLINEVVKSCNVRLTKRTAIRRIYIAHVYIYLNSPIYSTKFLEAFNYSQLCR